MSKPPKPGSAGRAFSLGRDGEPSMPYAVSEERIAQGRRRRRIEGLKAAQTEQDYVREVWGAWDAQDT